MREYSPHRTCSVSAEYLAPGSIVVHSHGGLDKFNLILGEFSPGPVGCQESAAHNPPGEDIEDIMKMIAIRVSLVYTKIWCR